MAMAFGDGLWGREGFEVLDHWLFALCPLLFVKFVNDLQLVSDGFGFVNDFKFGAIGF
ncbi:MAG: hypothetical protein LCH37_05770 [Bacteroidetes bacterium]|nr:hypothetical protein [Bacteroidota bacterium]